MTTPNVPSDPWPGGGTLLGTNSLQQTVDRFSSAVSKLENVVSQLGTLSRNISRPVNSQTASGSTGNTGRSLQQFLDAQGGMSVSYFPRPFNPFRSGGSANPLNLGAPGAVGYSGQTPWMATAPSYSSVGAARQAAANQMAGQTALPVSPYAPQAATSNGGWGPVAAAGAGFAVGAGFAAARAFGNSQLQQQVAANTLAWQGFLGQNSTNINAYTRSLYYNAFGSNNINLNDMAVNMQDATAGMANIMAASMTATPWSTPLGRTVFGAARNLSFANPSLTFSQTSSMAGQLYSPATSFKMLQMGYGAQPLKLGGGQNNMSTLVQSILQRTGMRNATPAQLMASRVFQADIGALGLTPDATQALMQTIQSYQFLKNKGLSYNKANMLFQAAETSAGYGGIGQGTAIAELGKYGINVSDIQALKSAQAIKTGRAADISGSFNSALQKSTQLLGDFNKVLTGIMDATGLNKILGIAGGIGAASHLASTSLPGIAGGVEHVLGGIVGGIGRIFGGSLPGSIQSPQSSGTGSKIASSPSAQAASAASWAEKELGVPYLWGGESPGVGFDCSGLTQWAYGKAGVRIPRTSEQQWASLSRRSVNLNSVEEGDLVFAAGSDGTAGSPGHVAMMISRNQIIEAPYTGANVRTRGYNPREWSHAGRPTGSLAGAGGPSSTNLAGLGANSMTAGQGNSGLALSSGGLGGYGGDYGSVSELSALQGAASAGLSGRGMPSLASMSGPQTGGSNSGGSTSTPISKSSAVNAMRSAAAKYGWNTGTMWEDIVRIENAEAGWNVRAVNPAGGSPYNSAYGLPQALPGKKMASAGPDWLTNPFTQSRWMMDYIHSKWENPAKAWENEQAFHWYAGGIKSSKGGLAILGERGPELANLAPGSTIFNNSQTMKILKAVQQPAQSPWSAFSSPTAKNEKDHGLEININFSSNSININGGQISNTEGLVQSLGAEIADRTAAAITRKELINSIARGDK